MKHLLKLDVTPISESIFEEKEVNFPVYCVDGFNSSDTRNFDDGTSETAISTEMDAFLSPTEKISLRFRSARERNGDAYETFEVVHRTLSKPKDDLSYYVKTEDTYDKPGTEDQFRALAASFKQFISCLSPYISEP